VDDMINGLIKLMNSNYTFPVNLGNPQEITMIDVAKIIINLVGSNSEIEFQDLPSDDPTRRNPDITRARNILGWEPKIELNDGLFRTINYFRKKIDIKKD